MKTNTSDKLSIREGGKEEFENTYEFARQASEIRKQVTDKYVATEKLAETILDQG